MNSNSKIYYLLDYRNDVIFLKYPNKNRNRNKKPLSLFIRDEIKKREENYVSSSSGSESDV